MNILSIEKQIAAISCLVEGMSIRATERLTGTHRDTIMRLAARIGFGAIKFHDRTMHSIQVPRIELDELWSFVGKKQKRVQPGEKGVVGDCYTFIGMASTAKAIISFRVGKRTLENTEAFAWDLRERIINAPEISTDGWVAYPEAIERAFGADCSYGQVVKSYNVPAEAMQASRRYSPGQVVNVRYEAITGTPRQISTSYVERQNLTVRMSSRRFTRLTNGFSKRADYHLAAVGLYVAHYNFCRVHESLRMTPAMALGVTDHIWTIGELIGACLANAPDKPRKVHRRFTVIQGGKKE